MEWSLALSAVLFSLFVTMAKAAAPVPTPFQTAVGVHGKVALRASKNIELEELRR